MCSLDKGASPAPRICVWTIFSYETFILSQWEQHRAFFINNNITIFSIIFSSRPVISTFASLPQHSAGAWPRTPWGAPPPSQVWSCPGCAASARTSPGWGTPLTPPPPAPQWPRRPWSHPELSHAQSLEPQDLWWPSWRWPQSRLEISLSCSTESQCHRVQVSLPCHRDQGALSNVHWSKVHITNSHLKTVMVDQPRFLVKVLCIA